MSKIFQVYHCIEDQDDCEISKLIGIFSNRKLAETAVKNLKSKPGFREFPDGFLIVKAWVDIVMWQEGFVRVDEL